MFDTYLFAYNGEKFYPELVQKFKTLENEFAATVTKVEDHGEKNPLSGTNREAKRLSAVPVVSSAYGQDTQHIRGAISAVAASLQQPTNGNLALDAYTAVQNLKNKLYYSAS